MEVRRGIGKSIIEQLLEKGFDVVNISRTNPDILGIEHHSNDVISETIDIGDINGILSWLNKFKTFSSIKN